MPAGRKGRARRVHLRRPMRLDASASKCPGAAVLAVALAVLGCGASVRRPHAPARIVPDVSLGTTSPAPDRGRAILDVVDGPARVWEVVADYPGNHPHDPLAGALLRRVCTSPCVVDLPHGVHRLAFTRVADRRRRPRDTSLVYIGPGTTVYRRALGRPPRTFTGLTIGGIVLAGISGAGVGAGLLGWSLGRAFGDEEMETSMAIVLGASMGPLVAGILMIAVGKDDGAEGVDVQWSIGGVNAP